MFCLCSLLGALKLCHLTFKSLSHFEFIFVHGVRVCSSFIDLHAAVQFSQHHFLKRLFPIYILASFVKDKLTLGLWIYFWVLYSDSMDCMPIFVPVPHCLDYCSFVILSEVWESYTSCLIFFPLRIALAILGLLWFHINFWIVCCSSVKNVMSNLIGIAINL